MNDISIVTDKRAIRRALAGDFTMLNSLELVECQNLADIGALKPTAHADDDWRIVGFLPEDKKNFRISTIVWGRGEESCEECGGSGNCDCDCPKCDGCCEACDGTKTASGHTEEMVTDMFGAPVVDMRKAA